MSSKNTVKKNGSALGYVFGGLSFIPLIGVLFGALAIIYGISKKISGVIFLGIAGILFTVILYGGLYYWGYVAKSGPFVELKKQLTVQILDQTKGQILIYRESHGKLPGTLEEIGKESTNSAVFTMDGYNREFIYSPDKDGKGFKLSSMGPDGTPSTEDDIYPTQ